MHTRLCSDNAWDSCQHNFRGSQGVLRKGQEIEIRPGIVTKDAEGRAACIPIYSRIITLLAEQNDLQYAVPGGLIGVGTTVSTSVRHVLLFPGLCPAGDVTCWTAT